MVHFFCPFFLGNSSEEICCLWNLVTLSCAPLAVAMLRRLTRPQLLFAAALGVAGGMYIYQPIFEQYSRDQKELKEKVKILQESEEKRS